MRQQQSYQPKTYGEGLGLLHITIQELHQKLQKYAQSANPQEHFINERLIIIEQLEESYKVFNKFSYSIAWEWMEIAMKDLDRRYTELSGHHIIFITKPTGKNLGLITFNPMQNENF
jgi:histidinol dehydrogenase